VQGPPPGTLKVSVIHSPADELESKLRDWLQQTKARVMASTQSAVSHDGQVLVTVVVWHQ
jgi:hypothetical protein